MTFETFPDVIAVDPTETGGEHVVDVAHVQAELGELGTAGTTEIDDSIDEGTISHAEILRLRRAGGMAPAPKSDHVPEPMVQTYYPGQTNDRPPSVEDSSFARRVKITTIEGN